jgi:hypothetical protein
MFVAVPVNVFLVVYQDFYHMSMGFIMKFTENDAFPSELIRLAKISKGDVFDKFGSEVFQKLFLMF